MTSGRRALLGAALAAAVVASYAGSLDAGFLNYDDDWLIERNWILGGAADPALDSPERSESRSALSILGTIWGDRSRETRLTLGAEYLPIRDTVVWLQLTAFGPNAPAMRVVSLLLYLAAALAMRRWLHGFVGRVLGPNRNGEFVAETSAWLFALHPVHVESVAWLAGQKDVLCLWFTALALLAYSDSRPRARWLAVVAGVAASLSKGPAVVLPLLLVATDLAQSRKIDWTVIGFSACAAAGIAGVQTSVGSTVGLFAPVHGGSRLATLATMGPVMWQYLGLSFGIVQPNIVEEVAIRSAADPWAWMAWAPLAGGVAATVWAARRGQRLPPFALGWFAIALAPVSQVVFPLQHLIADRYLFVAVLGPCLVVAWGLGEWRARGRARWPLAVAVALCAAATLGTAYRTVLFGDSLLLWMDATRRTERSPAGPYQLGMALEAAGNHADAEAAFRVAAQRDGARTETGRKATNNLARLLARRGAVGEAIALYRGAARAWPDDPKVQFNLAELLAQTGQHDEARRRYREVMRRFPSYTRARRAYETRYGPLRD